MNQRYEVSVSTLEDFRKYLAGKISREEFFSSLLGKKEETPAMRLGKALHKVFENPHKYYVPEAGEYNAEGFWFEGKLIEKIEEELAEMGMQRSAMSFEVPVTKEYGGVMVKGRIDGMMGNWLVDLKTTERQKRYDDFLWSVQWRFYCDMVEASRFFYLVVEINERLGAGVYSFDYVPERTNHLDLLSLVDDFVRFVNGWKKKGVLV